MSLKSSLINSHYPLTHTHIQMHICKSTHSSYHCWKLYIGDKLQNRCWHWYANTNRASLCPQAPTRSFVNLHLDTLPQKQWSGGGGERRDMQPMPNSPLAKREVTPGGTEDGKEGERSAAQECVWVCVCSSNYCFPPVSVYLCASYFPVLTSLKRSH